MPKQEMDANELYNLAMSVVGLVLTEGYATLEELADHFKVSEKAVLKAVTTIANSEDQARFETHFYLDSDALAQGEVVFGQGQGNLERPPALSRAQLSALAMGLEFLSSLEEFSGNSDLAELRQALGVRTEIPAKAASFQFSGLVEQIRFAILDQKQVNFAYVNQLGANSERVVDPLRVDLIGAKHYLRGFCHQSSELRTFRIDRISNLSISENKISSTSLAMEIPEEIYGSGEGELVKLSASPQAQEIFWNFPSFDLEWDSTGNRVGSIKVGNLAALARHVVRYGGEVEVLSPESARELVLHFAQRALDESDLEVE